jgi:tetratricopeptide (TPR) repeat protein
MLDQSVALMLKIVRREPEQYSETMVAAMIDITNSIGHSGLADKAVEYSQAMVDLLAELSSAPNHGNTVQLKITHYDAICGLTDALKISHELERCFIQFDAMHDLIQSLPMDSLPELATNYAFNTLQHTSLLLQHQDYQRTIEIADLSQGQFDQLFDIHHQDHRTESTLAQLVAVEALVALEQFNDALTRLTTLESEVKGRYLIKPQAAAENYMQVLSLLAMVYTQTENHPQASEKYQQVLAVLHDQELENHGQYPDLYWQLGTSLCLQDQHDQAIEYLQQAIDYNEQLEQQQQLADSGITSMQMRELLIVNLIGAEKYPQALQKSQYLLQSQIGGSLQTSGSNFSLESALNEIIAQQSDEPEAAECSKKILEILAPLLSA